MPATLQPPVDWTVTEMGTEDQSLSGARCTGLLTGEFVFGNSRYAYDFIWDHGNSGLDAANGGRCAQTGYWAAGNALVTVDGLQFIDCMAPDVVDK